MPPVFLYSVKRSPEIKNPLNTKKRSTPTHPTRPQNCGPAPCRPITSRTAIARNISSLLFRNLHPPARHHYKVASTSTASNLVAQQLRNPRRRTLASSNAPPSHPAGTPPPRPLRSCARGLISPGYEEISVWFKLPLFETPLLAQCHLPPFCIPLLLFRDRLRINPPLRPAGTPGLFVFLPFKSSDAQQAAHFAAGGVQHRGCFLNCGPAIGSFTHDGYSCGAGAFRAVFTIAVTNFSWQLECRRLPVDGRRYTSPKENQRVLSSRMESRERGTNRREDYRLLLEQILERLPRIVRPDMRGRRCRCRRGLRVRSRRRIFFNRHAEFIELAIVLGVLRRNALRNWLCAFRLRPGIEKPALLAAMQFRLALRTLPVGIEPRREHRAAIRATPARDRADHPRRARPELVRSPRPPLRRGSGVPPVSFFFLVVLFRVSIPAVAVLTVHKRLRPPVLTDCNTKTLYYSAMTRTSPWLISSRNVTLGQLVQSSPGVAARTVYTEQEMGHLCF